MYMNKLVTNIIYLKRQLYGMRMKEGLNIADHLNVFNTFICQLSSMDVKIDDEDKVVNLLCTLPEFWGQVVSSISLFFCKFMFNLLNKDNNTNNDISLCVTRTQN